MKSVLILVHSYLQDLGSVLVKRYYTGHGMVQWEELIICDKNISLAQTRNHLILALPYMPRLRKIVVEHPLSIEGMEELSSALKFDLLDGHTLMRKVEVWPR